ncbi:hypothetical protein [Vibrio panuliri]|uniref:Uncharacterized protein n=1 Tax=Vibrio panuliri TaxID=1381081 RepID=A0ABX3FRE5_9VIBR|nr:hypothetical protein [Vibrio panuliri]KAB1454647.1 hypothetical protein F7O85_17435 [Vibrio panuliri]OLQ96608.1 hypothetical protein BIY20_18500 [Vibrio panuliri]
MGPEALIFAVDVFITTCCMYIASKLSFVSVEFKALLIIAVIVSLVSLVPVVGWAAGLILFVYLLSKAASASFGDCIWVVLFTKLISAGAIMLIGSMFA